MRRSLIFFLFVFAVSPQLQAQVHPPPDTLEIGGITVIRDNAPPPQAATPKRNFFKKLGSSTRPKNIKTDWVVIDIGVSNFVDKTDYSSVEAQAYAPMANEDWLGRRPFKSRNVNIWLVTQQFNLIRHVVNFKYSFGAELNNYFYKQPIRYTVLPSATADEPVIHYDQTPDRTYRKNKLAADYFTIPVMLNFNLTPYRLYPFEISAGMSVGYLYAARNKFINSDEGKKKTRGDFDLDPWKLSYVGEVNLGVIQLYGSYAFKSMYTRGLDITPYNFGLRIKPTDLFSKIETN